MSLKQNNLDLLEVKPSNVHGLGAFALTNIPPGTLIGPYKGKYMNANQRLGVTDGTYIWKINEDRFVDAKNYLKNNPLRYINGSKTKQQQKLINCEMRNIGKTPETEKVYYVTTKFVPKGSELIISYGNNYFPKTNKK